MERWANIEPVLTSGQSDQAATIYFLPILKWTRIDFPAGMLFSRRKDLRLQLGSSWENRHIGYSLFRRSTENDCIFFVDQRNDTLIKRSSLMRSLPAHNVLYRRKDYMWFNVYAWLVFHYTLVFKWLCFLVQSETRECTESGCRFSALSDKYEISCSLTIKYQVFRSLDASCSEQSIRQI